MWEALVELGYSETFQDSQLAKYNFSPLNDPNTLSTKESLVAWVRANVDIGTANYIKDKLGMSDGRGYVSR